MTEKGQVRRRFGCFRGGLLIFETDMRYTAGIYGTTDLISIFLFKLLLRQLNLSYFILFFLLEDQY